MSQAVTHTATLASEQRAFAPRGLGPVQEQDEAEFVQPLIIFIYCFFCFFLTITN